MRNMLSPVHSDSTYADYEFVSRPNRERKPRHRGTFAPIDMAREPGTFDRFRDGLHGASSLLGKMYSKTAGAVMDNFFLFFLVCFIIPGLLIFGLVTNRNQIMDMVVPFDGYQVCPKYHGTGCTVLDASEGERGSCSMFSECFYNKKDPSKFRNFEYATVRRISSKNFER